MGSMLGNWPSYDPHNFSQLRPSDPSNPSRLSNILHDPVLFLLEIAHEFGRFNCETKFSPATYHPTHNRTLPPPDQVIHTETKNILLRHIYQRAEEKLRPKRAASENLAPEHGYKQLRASVRDTSY